MRLFLTRLILTMGMLAAAIAPGSAQSLPRPVDLRLALAIDSSSSVNIDEYYLQLEGYAAAFRHPDLLKAIQRGSHQAIAVMLYEWSSDGRAVVNFEWRLLESETELNRFADELALAPRLVVGGQTAIGDAIDFGVKQFDSGAFEGGRRVIDVSGDGVSNRGRPVTEARDDALAMGIIINGLAVLNEEPMVDDFYRRFVIGGSGSFVLGVRDYTDFAEAILKKLLREIAPVAVLTNSP
jgi:hypothetical protein